MDIGKYYKRGLFLPQRTNWKIFASTVLFKSNHKEKKKRDVSFKSTIENLIYPT